MEEYFKDDAVVMAWWRRWAGDPVGLQHPKGANLALGEAEQAFDTEFPMGLETAGGVMTQLRLPAGDDAVV